MKTGAYSEAEDNLLIAGVRNGRTSVQIAYGLDRSTGSVERRREKLRKAGRVEKVVQGVKPRIAMFQDFAPVIRMVISPWFDDGNTRWRTVRAA